MSPTTAHVDLNGSSHAHSAIVPHNTHTSTTAADIMMGVVDPHDESAFVGMMDGTAAGSASSSQPQEHSVSSHHHHHHAEPIQEYQHSYHQEQEQDPLHHSEAGVSMSAFAPAPTTQQLAPSYMSTTTTTTAAPIPPTARPLGPPPNPPTAPVPPPSSNPLMSLYMAATDPRLGGTDQGAGAQGDSSMSTTTTSLIVGPSNATTPAPAPVMGQAPAPSQLHHHAMVANPAPSQTTVTASPMTTMTQASFHHHASLPPIPAHLDLIMAPKPPSPTMATQQHQQQQHQQPPKKKRGPKKGRPMTVRQPHVAHPKRRYVSGVRSGSKRDDQWNIMFLRLQDYKYDNGNCNVPQGYLVDPELATWVKNQRQAYRYMLERKTTKRISPERVTRLNHIGFEWRKYNKDSDGTSGSKWRQKAAKNAAAMTVMTMYHTAHAQQQQQQQQQQQHQSLAVPAPAAMGLTAKPVTTTAATQEVNAQREATIREAVGNAVAAPVSFCPQTTITQQQQQQQQQQPHMIGTTTTTTAPAPASITALPSNASTSFVSFYPTGGSTTAPTRGATTNHTVVDGPATGTTTPAANDSVMVEQQQQQQQQHTIQVTATPAPYNTNATASSAPSTHFVQHLTQPSNHTTMISSQQPTATTTTCIQVQQQQQEQQTSNAYITTHSNITGQAYTPSPSSTVPAAMHAVPAPAPVTNQVIMNGVQNHELVQGQNGTTLSPAGAYAPATATKTTAPSTTTNVGVVNGTSSLPSSFTQGSHNNVNGDANGSSSIWNQSHTIVVSNGNNGNSFTSRSIAPPPAGLPVGAAPVGPPPTALLRAAPPPPPPPQRPSTTATTSTKGVVDDNNNNNGLLSLVHRATAHSQQQQQSTMTVAGREASV